MNRFTTSALAIFVTASLAFGFQACSKPSPQTDGEHQQDEHHQEQSENEAMPTMSHELSRVYNIELLPSATPYEVGKENTLALVVKEKDTGIPVRNFETVHEKTSHLILVSQDLTVFEHLHPDIVGPGKLQVKTQLPKAGPYIIYLQISTPEQGEQTIRTTLQAGEGEQTTAQLVPDADKPKRIGGYTFRLASYPKKANEMSMPTFSIEKDGKAVNNIRPYLGAGGHGVIISEDTQTFLHVHPMAEAQDGVYSSPLMFHTNVEMPGLYKIWGQFDINGSLQVADFVFEVK